jgi:preprotein translocase subunit SecE
VGSSPSSPAISLLYNYQNRQFMKNPFRSIREFFSEMITELKKASWPTFVELRDSTIVVLLATVLLGTFIALSDFSLLNGVEFLTSLVR